MRYLATIICLMCAVSGFALNETVAAISYNPSRTGAYTTLRITKGGLFAGGLVANEMNVYPATDQFTIREFPFVREKNNPVRNGTAAAVHKITTIAPAQDDCETADDCQATIAVPSGMQGASVQNRESLEWPKVNQMREGSFNPGELAVTLYGEGKIQAQGGETQQGDAGSELWSYIGTLQVSDSLVWDNVTIEMNKIGGADPVIFLPGNGTLTLGNIAIQNEGEAKYEWINVTDTSGTNHTLLGKQ